MLSYINSKVSLSIPVFGFVKQENGLYFVGYKSFPRSS